MLDMFTYVIKSRLSILYFAVPLSLFLLNTTMAFGKSGGGVLKLTIIESETRTQTPSRIEITGADGKNYIATNALLVGGDCDTKSNIEKKFDLKTELTKFSKKVKNRYTGTIQFYSNGKSEINLPAGPVSIKVFKGPEYKVTTTVANIYDGKTTEQIVEISRWSNMPIKGWYSSDDHLHISRPVKELNPYIISIMQAEDIHVANLLQMGKAEDFSIASQYAHGEEGLFKSGNYILAAGQENPRTHVLGHAITLGAKEALHQPENYVIYRLLWQEAANQNAINGAAHFGHGLGGNFGLPIVLPHNLMHFMEVLSFNHGDYNTWYEVLNLGFRVAPTAGTDYPCGIKIPIPGHERFYTKVNGDFSYENWLDGVRKGRTFVTTGPLLEFSINEKSIGDDILLEQSGSVKISGKVVFDPSQDNLLGIELIENGNVILSVPRVSNKGEISFEIKHSIKESSWLALRGYGDRAINRLTQEYSHVSAVHSAPIYITVKGAVPFTSNSRTKVIARSWLEHLKNLEVRLNQENINQLAEQFLVPSYDSVPKNILIKNRDILLDEIEEAKKVFLKLSE